MALCGALYIDPVEIILLLLPLYLWVKLRHDEDKEPGQFTELM